MEVLKKILKRSFVLLLFIIFICLNLASIFMLTINNPHSLNNGYSQIAFLASMGVINFYGILMISNYLSGSNPLDTGEFRQAITASFVVIYLTLIILSILPNNSISLVSNKFFDSFSNLTLLIVTYYFGSRSLKDWEKTKNKTVQNKSEETNAQPQ